MACLLLAAAKDATHMAGAVGNDEDDDDDDGCKAEGAFTDASKSTAAEPSGSGAGAEEDEDAEAEPEEGLPAVRLISASTARAMLSFHSAVNVVWVFLS